MPIALDRYTEQSARQKLMRRIAQAEEAAKGYRARSNLDQAREWDLVANQARAELRALSTDLPE